MSDFSGFDFKSVESETRDFKPMPQGEYMLEVLEAEKKQTKAGTGAYIKFKFKVVSPEKYNKRYVWDNVNVLNPNKDAQEIGLSRLKKMLELAGFSEEEMANKGIKDLKGKKYSCFLKHESFNGKVTEKIASLDAVSGTTQNNQIPQPNNVPEGWL